MRTASLLTVVLALGARRLRRRGRREAVHQLPQAARAKRLEVGIGDQNAAMFSDKRWEELSLKVARYVMPWNGLDTNRERVTAWFDAARKAGVRPLVAFNHSLGDQCPNHPCEAPTPEEFEQAFRKFHERYPWVKDVSPWNEANHQSQPTGRRPDLAAAYFDVVAECAATARSWPLTCSRART